MNKETYERIKLVITEFDGEEILTSSGEGGGTGGNPGPGSDPASVPVFSTDDYEMPVGF